MAKLHELLAAEGPVKAQADKCRTELLATFEKKRHLFEKKVVTFTSNAEGAAPATESQSELNSTVPVELAWIGGIWSKAIDAAYQVAESNMGARADVILEDGTKLLEAVPATALLELEKRASEIFALISGIPTLDPAKGFTPDSTEGKGISKAREVVKIRTQKKVRPLVKYEATKEHPAQVELVSEDVPVGTVREQEWSGLITPGQKADMLARAEELRRALKQARARANDAPAATTKIADKLFGYVFKL